jgi:alkylation response protein AidB-like acyl-CoA dehydrogenase
VIQANVGLTEEQIMLRDTALRFAQEKMEPFAAKWDEQEIFPVDTLRAAAELGFGGVYTKDDVGGTALSRMDAAIIFEALSTACVSTTAYISIHKYVLNLCTF